MRFCGSGPNSFIHRISFTFRKGGGKSRHTFRGTCRQSRHHYLMKSSHRIRLRVCRLRRSAACDGDLRINSMGPILCSVCVSYVGSSDVLSERRQQRSSGAALGTRLRISAGLVAKIEAAGDGCFQSFGRLYPRRRWIFLHVTTRRDGFPGLRCRIGESRHATKFSNPPNPRVPIRACITAAKSTLILSARALLCAQDTLCRLKSVRRPG